MKLSIVIPAHGRQADIDDTLLSVLENRPEDCEIVLAHPAGYQDPYQLDDEVRLIAATANDSISILNAGISAAHGRVIHTLAPGLQVQAGWCESALDAFEDDASVGSVAPAILEPRAKTPVRGVAYHAGPGKQIVRKPNQTVLAPLVASGFYLRRALQFMHGFDARYADWADVELGLRMFSAKYQCVPVGDVPLAATGYQVSPVMNGFRAGQIRGSLFAQAKAFGLTQSQGLAVLTEPFRNGLGLGILSGPLGRLACRRLRPLRSAATSSACDPQSIRNRPAA